MMKKLLWALLAVLLLSFSGAMASDWMYIDGVTADRVHLRQSAAWDAESLGLYFNGTPVERMETLSGGWSRVRIGSETGYVRTEFLAEEPARAFPLYEVRNLSSTWINLRVSASMDAPIAGRLDNGDRVSLMGETASGWSYVETVEGRRDGYVRTDLLAEAVQPAYAASLSQAGKTSSGEYIVSLELDNGQVFYFTSVEPMPKHTWTDMNFDGYPDIMVTVSRGAVNTCWELFLWYEGVYVCVAHPGSDYLANVQFDPAGYVLSQGDNGAAGALYEDCLFVWEGRTLRLLRRAVADFTQDMYWEGEDLIVVYHKDTLGLTITEYGVDGECRVIHTETAHLPSLDADELARMKDALWEGLR